jgi:hypothetical protein
MEEKKSTPISEFVRLRHKLKYSVSVNSSVTTYGEEF